MTCLNLSGWIRTAISNKIKVSNNLFKPKDVRVVEGCEFFAVDVKDALYLSFMTKRDDDLAS